MKNEYVYYTISEDSTCVIENLIVKGEKNTYVHQYKYEFIKLNDTITTCIQHRLKGYGTEYMYIYFKNKVIKVSKETYDSYAPFSYQLAEIEYISDTIEISYNFGFFPKIKHESFNVDSLKLLSLNPSGKSYSLIKNGYEFTIYKSEFKNQITTEIKYSKTNFNKFCDTVYEFNEVTIPYRNKTTIKNLSEVDMNLKIDISELDKLMATNKVVNKCIENFLKPEGGKIPKLKKRKRNKNK